METSSLPRISGVCRSNDNSGFTLVELLVLILVIGILFSVLAPVIRAVNEEMNRAQCRDNLRVQLAGMHVYAEDNNNTGYWEVQSPGDDSAPYWLYPSYVDDVNRFLCPSTRNVIDLNHQDRHGRPDHLRHNAAGGREDDRGGHSYEYFGYYGQGELAGVLKTPDTTEGLEAVTILVFDAADDPSSNNCPIATTGNHYDAGFNFGFVDGHVEWVPRREVNRTFQASFHGAWCPPEPPQVTRIERRGERIELNVDNPSGIPYQVQRSSDLAEWETIAVDQTEDVWEGTVPAGADRVFWRILQ